MGTETRFHWGDDPRRALLYCNGADPALLAERPDKRDKVGGLPAFPTPDGHVYQAPVGSFRPNAYGLFDMHGNVHEWTGDAEDPGDPGHLLARGGSWGTGIAWCRSGHVRSFEERPARGWDQVGFRIVAEPRRGGR